MTHEGVNVLSLAGVWQRRLLVQNGQRDDTSAVYWLQYGTVACDIRARVGNVTGDTAFAGELTQHNAVFRWAPAFEHGCLTGGKPDEGKLHLVDDDLFETGIHSPYLEHWHRIAPVGPNDFGVSFKDPETGQTGYLIEIGPYAFCARPNANGGGAFILAERRDGCYSAQLFAGCSVATHAEIDWPHLRNGMLHFPASALGPSGQTKATRLSINASKEETIK